jgi:8-oxo-dGTP pyrophosphatase MutT (NUDIX family)
MKRMYLINLLNSYLPSGEEEIKFKTQMLNFIDIHADCFERSLIDGHITGSAWLVNRDQSKALLMHHAKLENWYQLGGHSDGDPNTLEVALKEAREESGLSSISPISTSIFDIDIHLIPENPKNRAHYHYDVRFLLQATEDEEVRANHESKQLLWISKDQNSLPTPNPSIIRMFNKWNNLTRVRQM